MAYSRVKDCEEIRELCSRLTVQAPNRVVKVAVDIEVRCEFLLATMKA